MLYIIVLLVIASCWFFVAKKRSKHSKNSILILKTTFPSEDAANAFCKAFCELKLIACGSVYKVKTSFIWSDKIQTNEEFTAEVKTHCVLQEKLIESLKHYHPYKLPQILFYKAKVEHDYYLWISTSLNIEEFKKKKKPKKTKNKDKINDKNTEGDGNKVNQQKQ